MKKIILVALVTLTSLSFIYAQDTGKADKNQANGSKPAFSVAVGPEVAVGITGALVGAQAKFAWQPGFFGLVAGVRTDVYLQQPDVYLVPSGGVRLGWFELTGGGTFKVADAPQPPNYIEAKITDATPFFRAGLSIPIGPVDLDIGARVMFVDTYVESSGNTFEDVVGDVIVTSILTAIGIAKLDLGLYYVFRF